MKNNSTKQQNQNMTASIIDKIGKKKNDDVVIIISIASCIISIFSSILYFFEISNLFGLGLFYYPLFEALGALIIILISCATSTYIVILIIRPDIPYKGLILLILSGLEIFFGSFLGGYLLLTAGLVRYLSKQIKKKI